jgi:hypothetical protein
LNTLLIVFVFQMTRKKNRNTAKSVIDSPASEPERSNGVHSGETPPALAAHGGSSNQATSAMKFSGIVGSTRRSQRSCS